MRRTSERDSTRNDDAAWSSYELADPDGMLLPEDGSRGRGSEENAATLTEREQLAIRRYTSAEYEPLNGRLWGGTISEVSEIGPLSHDLTSALEKLPRHEGTVYRGSKPGRRAETYELDRYEPGQTVVENGYLSCSTNPNEEFDGEILWVIESKSGRDMKHTPRFPVRMKFSLIGSPDSRFFPERRSRFKMVEHAPLSTCKS